MKDWSHDRFDHEKEEKVDDTNEYKERMRAEVKRRLMELRENL